MNARFRIKLRALICVFLCVGGIARHEINEGELAQAGDGLGGAGHRLSERSVRKRNRDLNCESIKFGGREGGIKQEKLT